MKFLFLNVGKTKANYFRAGIEHYIENVKNFCEVEYVELKSAHNNPKEEVDGILESLAKRDYQSGKKKLIVCDERGKMLDSNQLAEQIQNWQDQGCSEICIIVGGAFGINQALRDQADLLLAFSPMVFPHELARLMATEQIYRAFNIINGSKYHH